MYTHWPPAASGSPLRDPEVMAIFERLRPCGYHSEGAPPLTLATSAEG